MVPGALNHIGEWIAELATPPMVLVCADTTVAGLYADRVLASLGAAGLKAALHTFPPGDASKSLAELDRIYVKLGEMKLARDGMMVALGGGVASDLTGFAAATWMRGVRFVTCPTTLESDVDACVGGKTGINHAAGKNLVGAFHHADLVAVDPECLQTLPERDVAAGLAESVKHALIADAAFLDWHESRVEAIQAREPAVMGELIERNLRIKVGVVETDEHEQGRRALLNFGHTIGHAIEALCGYELRHGEAVALGMVAAADLSRSKGMLGDADVARIRAVLERFHLPTVVPIALEVDAVAALTLGDKKVRGGRRRWVLLDGIGCGVVREDVDEEQIRAAITMVTAGA
ncbi:MAG TPA: 3-dehydroquinate synthase [Phycisphaerae bacterium]|nr:3-dehydroquinate synthase [Phycisphaerales bacterium]HRX87589.1 3-dehydroquinate synthase [Phycisphaerae bacterium]